MIKSFLPTIFSNNWYMTCYLLFYLMHTVLNKAIYGMGKKELFRSMFILSILYMGINFVKGDLLFPSVLILWVTIYFFVAYVKLYLKDCTSKASFNRLLLFVGCCGSIGIVFITNLLGLRIEYFSDKLLHWNSNCNPFIILTAMALFNLVRNVEFSNKLINYVSGLSLLVYIIHENIIIRTYYRPRMTNYVFEHFDNIVWGVIALSIAIYIASIVVSVLYDLSLRKVVRKGGLLLYSVCVSIWRVVEQRLLKLH